jgi:hypothetical protein
MRSDRMPLLGIAGAGVMGLASLLAVQPYSAPSPHSHFDAPAHRYLVAALRRDTATLNRLTAAPHPITWAVRTEATERRALAAWASSARASLAFSRGDTTEVWYESATDACPFRLTFAGPKVVEAHARCYTHRGWPSDPTVIAVTR